MRSSFVIQLLLACSLLILLSKVASSRSSSLSSSSDLYKGSTLGISIIQPVGVAAKKGKGQKGKTKDNKDSGSGSGSGSGKHSEQVLFRGTAPQIDGDWKSAGKGVVYTDVSTSAFKFSRTPTILCTVVKTAQGNKLPGSGTDGLFGGKEFGDFDFSAYLNPHLRGDTLTNVTGKHTPRNVSPEGFQVRLQFAPHVNDTLKPGVAISQKWKVRYIAVTEEYPKFQLGGKYDDNDELDEARQKGIHPLSIDRQFKVLESLIEEEESVVKGLLASDYQPPLSQVLKLEKEKAEKEEKRKQAKAQREADEAERKQKRKEKEEAKAKTKAKSSEKDEKDEEDEVVDDEVRVDADEKDSAPEEQEGEENVQEAE